MRLLKPLLMAMICVVGCSEPENGLNSLVAITSVEPGSTCQFGGSLIESGIDSNDNDVLDSDEVTSSSYVCNGADGLNSLVNIAALEPGEQCIFGGNVIESGIDTNSNGELEPGEVASTATICNGENGLNTIMAQENIAPGEDCANGGVQISYGLDANYDNTLQSGEITDSFIICYGENGLNSLVSVEQLSAGDDCPSGGILVQSGLDVNENGVLDVDEITSAEAVCRPSGSVDEQILDQVAADSIMAILDELGLEIHRGTNPPNIENTYLVSPLILINSNRSEDNVPSTFADLMFQAMDQNNDNLTVKIVQSQGGSTGDAQGGFIIGDNNRFTILLDIVTVQHDLNDSTRMLTAYSGEITETGIENYQISITMTNDFGDPNNRYIEIGDSRVFEDGDGFSGIIDEDLSNARVSGTTNLKELLLSY